MALPQRTNGRSRHRMVLLALTAVTLLSLDLSSFGPVGGAQRLVRDVLHPVTELAGTILSPFSDAWNAVFDYDDLEAENERLREENDRLRGNEMAVEAAQASFERLEAATVIEFRTELSGEAARVIRGSVGNFDSDVVTIDRGSRDGIDEGMAVVTSAGLVGRVERADATTSTVVLLSDSDQLVGVRLSNGAIGLGHTDPENPAVFVIDQGLDWPPDGDPERLPEIGSVVVTAAMSRYPAEIPIGRVVDVRPSSDELTMIVEVEMGNDVTDLSYVTVLLAQGVDQVPLPDEAGAP